MKLEYIYKKNNTKEYVNRINKAFDENKVPLLSLTPETDTEIWFILLQKPLEIIEKQLVDPDLEEEGMKHNIVILKYPERHIRINLTTGFTRIYTDDDTIEEWYEEEIKTERDILSTIEKLIEEYKKAYKIFFVFYSSKFDTIYLECERRVFKFHLS